MKRPLIIIIVSLFCISSPFVSHADTVKVEIVGIHGKLKKNVLAFLEIANQSKPLSRQRIKVLYAKGFGQIEYALRPFGYFRPEIKGVLKPISEKRHLWLAKYVVDTRDRIKISKIIFRVKGPGKNQKFARKPPPFSVGQYFDQMLYERFKQDVLHEAFDSGYLDAFFEEKKVEIDLSSYTASITLVMDTGQRYLFGPILFDKTIFAQDFLLKYAGFRQGDPFERKRLLEFRSRLLDSDYFSKVDLSANKPSSPSVHEIPVKVHLSEKKPNAYRLGLGYVSDSGPRFTLRWDRRYFGSRGHRLRAVLKMSSEESSLSAMYFIPVGRPYSDYVSFSPSAEYYDTDSRRGWEYSADFVYSVAVSRGWRRNIGFKFGYENYQVGGDDEDAKEFVPFVSFQKTVADNLLVTNRGYMMRFDLSGEIEGFFADCSYLSTNFKTKFIRRLSENYRFISRLNLGLILTGDIRELPASVRYYAGGYNSIRGFGFEELGPINPEDGKITGGRYLAVTSLEMERYLMKNLALAVFVDMGNSFDPDFKNRLEVGTGFGFRLSTPIGPVRVDFGFGVTKKDVPFKFYLTFGPDL